MADRRNRRKNRQATRAGGRGGGDGGFGFWGSGRGFYWLAAGIMVVWGLSMWAVYGRNGNPEIAAAQPAADAVTTGTLQLPLTAPDPNKVNLTPLATFARALGQLEVRIEIKEKELGVLYQQRERLMIEMLKVD